MMYNIYDIDNNLIDTQTSLIYLRFLPRAKKVVKSDSSSANCIYSSDRKQIYAIQSKIGSVLHNYPVVRIEQTTDATDVCSATLNSAKEQKIAEFRTRCQEEITKGIIIKLNSEIYEFELTVEDQLNLKSLQLAIDSGCESLVYHAKNKPCQVFSKSQMLSIIRSAERHIHYHTTYFNIMKHCINNMKSLHDVTRVQYGDPVPKSQQELLNLVI